MKQLLVVLGIAVIIIPLGCVQRAKKSSTEKPMSTFQILKGGEVLEACEVFKKCELHPSHQNKSGDEMRRLEGTVETINNGRMRHALEVASRQLKAVIVKHRCCRGKICRWNSLRETWVYTTNHGHGNAFTIPSDIPDGLGDMYDMQRAIMKSRRAPHNARLDGDNMLCVQARLNGPGCRELTMSSPSEKICANEGC